MKNLHPLVLEKTNLLLTKAKEAGLTVEVFHGFRSVEDQNALYAQGRTKPGPIITKARGGLSWHNYGLAVDVVFGGPKKWSWAESNNWALLGKLGKECGFEWGGNWKQVDKPHFQYCGSIKNIREALRLYQKGGLRAVWQAVDKK